MKMGLFFSHHWKKLRGRQWGARAVSITDVPGTRLSLAPHFASSALWSSFTGSSTTYHLHLPPTSTTYHLPPTICHYSGSFISRWEEEIGRKGDSCVAKVTAFSEMLSRHLCMFLLLQWGPEATSTERESRKVGILAGHKGTLIKAMVL